MHKFTSLWIFIAEYLRYSRFLVFFFPIKFMSGMVFRPNLIAFDRTYFINWDPNTSSLIIINLYILTVIIIKMFYSRDEIGEMRQKSRL